MEKLINQFEFGLFFWQILIFVGLILLLKSLKPILDAVKGRRIKTHYFLLKMQREMLDLQTDNQRILPKQD
jgi:F-type H+-transporting ATPase subunit b